MLPCPGLWCHVSHRAPAAASPPVGLPQPPVEGWHPWLVLVARAGLPPVLPIPSAFPHRPLHLGSAVGGLVLGVWLWEAAPSSAGGSRMEPGGRAGPCLEGPSPHHPGHRGAWGNAATHGAGSRAAGTPGGGGAAQGQHGTRTGQVGEPQDRTGGTGGLCRERVRAHLCACHAARVLVHRCACTHLRVHPRSSATTHCTVSPPGACPHSRSTHRWLCQRGSTLETGASAHTRAKRLWRFWKRVPPHA